MKVATIMCQNYKVGLRGKVFREVDGEWRLTNNVTAREVELAIQDQERKQREKEEKIRERERAKRARSGKNKESGEDNGEQHQENGSCSPVPAVF